MAGPKTATLPSPKTQASDQDRSPAAGQVRALRHSLRKICDAHSDETEARKAVAAFLRAENERQRAEIAAHFLAHPKDTYKTIHAYTELTDLVVKLAFEAASKFLPNKATAAKGDKVSIIAVGGYGRAEMAPFSDVDLLFLTPAKHGAWVDQVLETFLYILWDMKLKIGHSTRCVEDCISLGKSDQTIKTTLLESRHLVGDKTLYNALQKRLWTKLFKGSDADYIEQKLEERAERHRRQGGQRYMVEPNVKEGKGGLRDLQTLFWITKHISKVQSTKDMVELGYFSKSEMKKFNDAHEFLWMVRCHLHLIAGRATEQVHFDMQVELAKRLGYTDKNGMRGVEIFMQQYFRHATLVGEVTRIFLTQLEAQHVKNEPSFGARLIRAMPWTRSEPEKIVSEGYRLDNGRLNIATRKDFLADPLNILRLFEEALRADILIHPDAMRLITANLNLITDDVRNSPEAQRIFIDLLLEYGNPERALRRMNELGVLGAFIPEFQRIIALMQFNNYHHYTVDEHIIQCISGLAYAEMGMLGEDLPVVTGILKKGLNRRVLYVALLLHDIGKGLPEDHSVAGARMAAEIAPRLGMNEAETDTIVWLIENHLVMSDFAQKRDLSDPRTVIKFSHQVKTRARLDLLTALTVFDIRGVGPGTWNNWKAQLIRELYRATLATLTAGLDKTGIYNRVDEAKEALAAHLSDWDADAMSAEIERHYDPYWQGLDTQSHAMFAKLLRDLNDGAIGTLIEPDEDRDATRACLVMQDHPGVFSRIVGALAIVNANIVDARSYTTSDGFATAIFWIQDQNGRPYEPSRFKRMSQMIEKTLMGEVLAKSALADRDKYGRRERDFIVPTEITFDNEGSELYSIIEVDTRDRPGLLHDLAVTLKNANIYIASAVIATYGAQAVDVFYVKDMFGTKIHSERKQKAIADRLRHAIERGAEDAMS